jgi:hypothetical protein
MKSKKQRLIKQESMLIQSNLKHLSKVIIDAQPGKKRHNNQDGYVVVKLSHPKRKFNERDATKELPNNCQSLGYTKKRYFGRFTKNPNMPGFTMTTTENPTTIYEELQIERVKE